MTISYFIPINKNKYVFILLLGLPCLLFSTPLLQTDCDQKICHLYLKQDNRVLHIVDGTKKTLNGFSFRWDRENELGRISAGCGTACVSQYFFNPKTFQISNNFEGVYLIDPIKLIVLVVDTNDSNLNTLILRFIFSEKSFIKITRNFWGSASTSIADIKLENNNIIMEYDGSGKNNTDEYRTEIIPIDYQKLNQGGCWYIDEAHQYIAC